MCQVQFRTEPRDAIVSLQQNGIILGAADQPLRVNLEPYRGDSTLGLVFSQTGYRPRTERVEIDALRRQGVYPMAGAVVLEPINALVPLLDPLRRHFYLIVAGLGLLLGYAGLRSVLAPSAKNPASASMTGKMVGRYRILQKIGAGGCATVYEAVSPAGAAQPTVAVKILNRRIRLSDDTERRFQREIRIGASLQHPSVVGIIDSGHHDGLMYLVMERVVGQSLRHYLTLRAMDGNAGVPLPVALPMLERIFEAVAYAHEKGVVHRDLKPENIMLVDGGIKVLDFGVARGDEFTTVTRTGTVYGSLNYLAPERLRGIADDARSDQYALGVIAYEMLAGGAPFARNQADVRPEEFFRGARPLHALRPDLSEGLCAVIMRMLDEDVDKRFATVGDALAAFEREKRTDPHASSG